MARYAAPPFAQATSPATRTPSGRHGQHLIGAEHLDGAPDRLEVDRFGGSARSGRPGRAAGRRCRRRAPAWPWRTSAGGSSRRAPDRRAGRGGWRPGSPDRTAARASAPWTLILQYDRSTSLAIGLTRRRKPSRPGGRSPMCGRSGLTPSITSAGARRRHQGADLVDDLLEVEVGGVDDGHARGGRVELGDAGIVPVTADHLVGHGGVVDLLAELGMSAGDPGGRVGDQQHPDRPRRGATTVVMSRPSATIPRLARRSVAAAGDQDRRAPRGWSRSS